MKYHDFLPELNMLKYINVIILFLTLFLLSCNGESIEPEEEKFSGITETGPESSEPIGKSDENDWIMVPVSGNVLEDVLSDYPAMALKPAYPNPTAGNKVTLLFSISRASRITMYIADKPGSIVEYIFKNEEKNAGEYKFLYTFNSNLKEGIYRVYLEIISPNAKYKSFGDIQYSK